ncbi:MULTISPECIES: bactofilin family protein [Undibacterium]|jgi:cytoskeletal protein CcmA (bactofilin family)|uniref:Polymer-forming cytoskeletal protein n=2 Tax=Undibacterium TaxID=401469 RepID=A0ABS5H3C1_9BURK|nr:MULTISPECIES: polymer-forming cytoskeletal protein [Undibacterium]MBY0570799.1 polymer-forming cytoskeletal protein [Burkholderiaceae bacterium]MBC3811636.1 polymer-forming cytoskeletal protein [Undibacterium aquatile]MBC3876323.1 polymer-forming cytoskeletal protein [Undibacterium sp. FT79W]MBC3928003.1 polymer-forming cytoskeletal protein [Undibacterium sp. CY21W]MBR7793128.1 polymer-forming cytoskeletal protein [Undibacterium rivi]
MFSRKTKSTIDSLIGSTTRIEGDLHFKGGLRIDGHIRGNVIADTESLSMLVISEQAVIDGEVRAAHIVVNGVINGPVFSTELLELQPKAKISGDVHYKTLEMLSGALVSGKLTHDLAQEPATLKLAASNA